MNSSPSLIVFASGPMRDSLLAACSGLSIANDVSDADVALVHSASAPVALAARHVIWVGERPPAGQRADAWFATPPSAQLLAALVDDLVVQAPEPAARQWRRKSDIIIGQSHATERLMATLDQLGSVSTSVLVTGESGTGKELVARALHYCGPRKNAPFIAINCAAIPEHLFESELFGHERGAFTGASSARAGNIEAAHGGTLFLDEVGDLPKGMQSKLLRVLETRQVVRLGSSTPKSVDVRLVAATNVDLLEAVKAGRFREDFYFRIAVYPVRLSPLRERMEDVVALAHHHLGLIAAREGRRVPSLTGAAVARLRGYRWPGNVRELVNVMERAFLACGQGQVDAPHLDLPEPTHPRRYKDARGAFERSYYEGLLQQCGGNISAVARIAGKTRKEVYDAIKRNGIASLAPKEDDDQDLGSTLG